MLYLYQTLSLEPALKAAIIASIKCAATATRSIQKIGFILLGISN